MSSNWYVVDTSGHTRGPLQEQILIDLFLKEQIHSKTYIWNGESVKEWMPICDVKYMYERIRHEYVNSSGQDSQRVSLPEALDVVDPAKESELSTSEYMDSTLESEVTPKESLPAEGAASSSYSVEADVAQENRSSRNQDTVHSVSTSNNRMAAVQRTATVSSAVGNGSNKKPSTKSTHSTPHSVFDYPPSLNFLQHDSERVGLMANIRSGIQLRDPNQSMAKQRKQYQPPKRVKDRFADANHDSQKEVMRIPALPDIDSNELCLSTSIDEELLSDVKENGYTNRNKRNRSEHKLSAPSEMDAFAQQEPQKLFTNELAERMSLLRKKFGDVEVATGNGRKHHSPLKLHAAPVTRGQAGILRSNSKFKSAEVAQRIAKLKDKLDRLTDQESWIVTRLERVFSAANI